MATRKAASKSAAPSTPVKPAAKKRRKAESLRTVSPSFTVADVEKSLVWYRDVLGFKVKERWEEKGKLLGVEIAAGEVTFMLGQDDWKKGRKRLKGEGVRLFCTTDQNIDRFAERIKSSGGQLTQEPTDQPWGMRDFSIQDPDGYKITIAADLKR